MAANLKLAIFIVFIFWAVPVTPAPVLCPSFLGGSGFLFPLSFLMVVLYHTFGNVSRIKDRLEVIILGCFSYRNCRARCQDSPVGCDPLKTHTLKDHNQILSSGQGWRGGRTVQVFFCTGRLTRNPYRSVAEV